MSQKTGRGLAAALLALAVGTPLIGNTGVSAAEPAPAAASKSTCREVPPAGTKYRDGKGQESDTPDSAKATVSYYSDNGTSYTEVSPPAGFKPTSATSEELAAYGFPPRPTDAEQLVEWEALFANYKGAAKQAKKCVDETVSYGTMTGIYNNNNWAGSVNDTYTDYRRVYGTFRYPTFSSSCGSLSDNRYGQFVGLGGVYSQKLLQTGVGANSDSNYGGAFWEAIGPVNSGARQMAVGFGAQDLAYSDAYYNSGNSTVTFYAQNVTTGFSSSETATSIGNYSPSSFYDGQSAEFIHERPTSEATGALTGLRNFGSAGVSGATVVRAGQQAQSHGNLPHFTARMTSSNGTIAYPANGLSSSTSFTENWYRCR